MFGSVTSIEFVVSPFDQMYESYSSVESVTLPASGWQASSTPSMVIIGSGCGNKVRCKLTMLSAVFDAVNVWVYSPLSV